MISSFLGGGGGGEARSPNGIYFTIASFALFGAGGGVGWVI